MANFEKKNVVKILNFFLAFAIIIGIFAFYKDLRNTIRYGGIDFRNRVVGARLLNIGLDPYYFKWTPGADERLLDPLDNPKLAFSRVTVSPSILLLHSPLANLPYFQQKIIWFTFQWSALVASCFLLISNFPNIIRRKITWILTLLFIFGSHFWRLHIAVGQIYILYVFLFSSAYFVLQKKLKYSEIIAGILIGLTASLRFPIIVIILPMIIFKKFKLLVATLTVFCLSLISSFIIAKPQAWSSYFSAMTTIGKFDADAKISINSEKFTMPTTVEGVGHFSFPQHFNINSSLQSLIKEIFSYQIPGNIFIFLCCIFLAVFAIFISSIYKKEIRLNNKLTWDIFFICGSLMILIGDLFIPAPRYTYNDIQFLIPLLLIFKNISFSNNKVIICILFLATGLFFLNGMFYWIPRAIAIGEYTIVTSMISIALVKSALTQNIESS